MHRKPFVTSRSLDEKTFLEAFRQKDHQAFQFLFDHYAAALFGQILRSVKDQQAAEDILQDSMVCIYRSSEQFDPVKGALFTWMLRIVRNKCIDHFRAMANRKSDCLPTESCTALFSQPYFDKKLDFDKIRHWISCKSPESMRMFELIYIYGFTQQQTAEICQMPTGTVKTKVRMMLKSLRLVCRVSSAVE